MQRSGAISSPTPQKSTSTTSRDTPPCGPTSASMAQQLAEARRKRAAHHSSRPPPVVKGELRVATYNVWFEHEDTFAKRMAAIAREWKAVSKETHMTTEKCDFC